VRRKSAALVAALLFAAALVAFAGTGAGVRLAGLFEKRSAPARAIGSPRLRAALARAELLVPQVPRPSDATRSPACGEIELAGSAVLPEEAPSTRIAPASIRSSPGPAFSIWLDPCRDARLHAFPELRGESTEELGWVSLFEGGRLRFASAVGIRLHGGVSRKHSPYSYRLYFRDRYGPQRIEADLLGGESVESISRLVLAEADDQDHDGTPWPFPGELALEISRRLGADVPRTRPVTISYNGESPRVATAIEQISRDLLRRRFGHESFDLLRGKREGADPTDALYAAELGWLEETPAPLTAARAAERYDVESLLDWLVSVVFCATGDLYQDALVRDRTASVREGRWFWIHWDRDMSFRTPPGNSRFGRFTDAFPYLVWSSRSTDVAPARSLLVRLLTEDPAFRRRVERHFEQALERELTPEFLEGLVARYEALAREAGYSDLHFAGELRRFFAARPDEVRAQVAEVLAAFDDPSTSRPPGLRRRRGPARAGAG
jgi:hypothetical protein